ncbi:hypothetical protein [Mycobacterium sp.]|uniref:hypothetical protein n=1 Tax=Mycobacterium sp. TaxID=1785 RepID=UPI003D144426
MSIRGVLMFKGFLPRAVSGAFAVAAASSWSSTFAAHAPVNLFEALRDTTLGSFGITIP